MQQPKCCMKNLTFFKFDPTCCNIPQHIATGWPKVCNMLCPTMLQDVALKYCERLARQTKMSLFRNHFKGTLNCYFDVRWSFVDVEGFTGIRNGTFYARLFKARLKLKIFRMFFSLHSSFIYVKLCCRRIFAAQNSKNLGFWFLHNRGVALIVFSSAWPFRSRYCWNQVFKNRNKQNGFIVFCLPSLLLSKTQGDFWFLWARHNWFGAFDERVSVSSFRPNSGVMWLFSLMRLPIVV